MFEYGFVDLQVNGLLGVDFAGELTLEDFKKAVIELAKLGTSAFCPTIVTGQEEMYKRNLAIIVEASKDPEISPHILGVHLEGPFISPKPGARGVHDAKSIIAPSIEFFDRLYNYAEGMVSILTLAPEEPGAIELIKHAVSKGVVVSLGHHFASNEQLQMAVDAGAKLCTHIGNGMPNEIHRHNNPLWWQLASDELYGMFITDGNHMPAPMVKVAFRAKTAAKSIVTSDAALLAGFPVGPYKWLDKDVVIEPSGRIYCPSEQMMAGSSATMIKCMNFLASLNLLNAEELEQVSVINPLKVLGKTKDCLKYSKHADVNFDGKTFTIN